MQTVGFIESSVIQCGLNWSKLPRQLGCYSFHLGVQTRSDTAFLLQTEITLEFATEMLMLLLTRCSCDLRAGAALERVTVARRPGNTENPAAVHFDPRRPGKGEQLTEREWDGQTALRSSEQVIQLVIIFDQFCTIILCTYYKHYFEINSFQYFSLLIGPELY